MLWKAESTEEGQPDLEQERQSRGSAFRSGPESDALSESDGEAEDGEPAAAAAERGDGDSGRDGKRNGDGWASEPSTSVREDVGFANTHVHPPGASGAGSRAVFGEESILEVFVRDPPLGQFTASGQFHPQVPPPPLLPISRWACSV